MKLSDYSTAIIVLAAGRGQRMGVEHGPKLLLPMGDGEPIIRHTIRTAAALEPAELVVVIRPDLPELADAITAACSFAPNVNIICVPNPRYQEGMATSLAAGVSALGERVEAALVMLGDMPFVAPGIVEGLIAAYASERKPVTIPVYGSEVGPPTLFSRQVFPDLEKMQGDVGGRQLLRAYPELACLVYFKEDDRPPDIDTPEDIIKLR